MPRGAALGKDGITIDARALSALAADLKRANPLMRLSLQRRMRGALDVTKAAVREEASFSSRIPGAVRGRISYPASGVRARVIVDAAAAPHARAINNAGRPGLFRHPVYGNRNVWVPQRANNFIDRAAQRSARRTQFLIAGVYDDFTRAAGFH